MGNKLHIGARVNLSLKIELDKIAKECSMSVSQLIAIMTEEQAKRYRARGFSGLFLENNDGKAGSHIDD